MQTYYPSEQKLPGKLLNAFNKIEIVECENCHKFISKKEFERGEGACFKCWDEPNKLK